jgi:diguanylate cyclase
VNQTGPFLFFIAGLSAGALLYPLSKILANTALGGFLDACGRIVTAPFGIVAGLFRSKSVSAKPGEIDKTSAQQTGASEEQTKVTTQAIRNILLSLTEAIQRAEHAASTSNQNLGDVRKSIISMNLPDELTEVHVLFMREVDRVIAGNTALKQELSSTQDMIANQRRQIDDLRSAVRLDTTCQPGLFR